MTAYRRKMEHLIIVLVVVCFGLMAVAAYSLVAARNLGDSLYAECRSRQVYDMQSNAARVAEVSQFRRLAALAQVNGSLPPEQRAARAESYEIMAVELQRAVDVAVVANCTQYQSPVPLP